MKKVVLCLFFLLFGSIGFGQANSKLDSLESFGEIVGGGKSVTLKTCVNVLSLKPKGSFYKSRNNKEASVKNVMIKIEIATHKYWLHLFGMILN